MRAVVSQEVERAVYLRHSAGRGARCARIDVLDHHGSNARPV